MNDLREQIIIEARTWLDVPFKHQGRSRNGIDCVGLVYVVGRALKILNLDLTSKRVAKYNGYTRSPEKRIIKSACEDFLIKISHSDLLPGDIVLMTFTESEPSHVAIYAGDSLIHTMSRVRKCTEHLIDDKWSNMFTGFYRYPGLSDE